MVWAAMSEQVSPARSLIIQEMRPLLEEPPLSKDDPRWKSYKEGRSPELERGAGDREEGTL